MVTDLAVLFLCCKQTAISVCLFVCFVKKGGMKTTLMPVSTYYGRVCVFVVVHVLCYIISQYCVIPCVFTLKYLRAAYDN